jgi:light-harvesting complex 1 beta chain
MHPRITDRFQRSGGISSSYQGVQLMANPSGLTEQQAKEFHEQFKITYTAYVGLAALVHLYAFSIPGYAWTPGAEEAPVAEAPAAVVPAE